MCSRRIVCWLPTVVERNFNILLWWGIESTFNQLLLLCAFVVVVVVARATFLQCAGVGIGILRLYLVLGGAFSIARIPLFYTYAL